MKDLKLSIIIIGKMRAGKSTLARELSNHLNFPVASFGGYLLNLSEQKNLPKDRESLQNLGNKLINESHISFLAEVMIFSSKTSSDIFIFEGVRHKVIYDEIIRRSSCHLSVFLDVNEETRLKRFLEGSKEIDKDFSVKDFYDRDSHPVEREIDLISKDCDIVSQTDNIAEIVSSITQKISELQKSKD